MVVRRFAAENDKLVCLGSYHVIRKEAGLSTEQVPVSAYGGCLQNLKVLKAAWTTCVARKPPPFLRVCVFVCVCVCVCVLAITLCKARRDLAENSDDQPVCDKLSGF